MQSLRFCSLALVVWCQPYTAYVPVTGASLSIPEHTTPPSDPDASGELPSTAEHDAPTAPFPGILLPFFPFFSIPPIDIGPAAPPRGTAYGPGDRR